MRIAVGFNNGIGNFIVFTQTLQCLSEYANGKVDLFIDRGWVDEEGSNAIRLLVENCRFINSVLVYPDDYNSRKYDFSFMSQQSNLCDMYADFVGEGKHFSDFKHWYSSKMHESIFYQEEAFKNIPYRGKIHKIYCPFDKKVDKAYRRKRYICIANGYTRTSDDMLARKLYPHFQEVVEGIDMLFPDMGVFVLGGEKDATWAKLIASQSKNAESLAGEMNILETAAVIKNAKAIVANDTGVFHMADALEVPGIAIFGPTLISKNGPLNDTIKIVKTPRSCAPCQGNVFWNMCKDPLECMRDIEPGSVVKALRSILF